MSDWANYDPATHLVLAEDWVRSQLARLPRFWVHLAGAWLVFAAVVCFFANRLARVVLIEDALHLGHLAVGLGAIALWATVVTYMLRRT